MVIGGHGWSEPICMVNKCARALPNEDNVLRHLCGAIEAATWSFAIDGECCRHWLCVAAIIGGQRTLACRMRANNEDKVMATVCGAMEATTWWCVLDVTPHPALTRNFGSVAAHHVLARPQATAARHAARRLQASVAHLLPRHYLCMLLACSLAENL